MKAQLHEFAKSDQMKYKFCGVRLSGLKKLAHENKRLTELFDLSQTHYYIYHTDSTQAWLVIIMINLQKFCFSKRLITVDLKNL